MAKETPDGVDVLVRSPTSGRKLRGAWVRPVVTRGAHRPAAACAGRKPARIGRGRRSPEAAEAAAVGHGRPGRRRLWGGTCRMPSWGGRVARRGAKHRPGGVGLSPCLFVSSSPCRHVVRFLTGERIRTAVMTPQGWQRGQGPDILAHPAAGPGVLCVRPSARRTCRPRALSPSTIHDLKHFVGPSGIIRTPTRCAVRRRTTS